MNLKNLFTLTIRRQNFNLVARQPELLKQLRKLTLYPMSGLNRELDHLVWLAKERPVKTQVLLAYRNQRLIAWALVSKEKSDFQFYNTGEAYDPSQGVLVEMYVNPEYRRQGIGTALMKVAKSQAKSDRLCVAPWDETSVAFYSNFGHYRTRWL
jgi:GNAT superfamily N-acetyltransferase